jgi:FkbM family methyltransferase
MSAPISAGTASSALVGRRGRVLSVEVDPRALRCLRLTVRRNSDLPIDIAAVAAAEADGTGRMQRAVECGHSVLSVSGRGRRVSTRTVDSLVAARGWPRVDLLKIDVEGAELRVLQGASEILRRYRPVVVCEEIDENLRAFGGTAHDIETFLHAMGYRTMSLAGAWSPTALGRYTAGHVVSD